MSEPVSSRSLAELAAVLKRLNEASDTLTTTIGEFEQTLIQMNPGITVQCSKFLRVYSPEDLEMHATASQLGFTKFMNKWGLFIRRGLFFEQSGQWHPIEDHAWEEFTRLVDASREDRIAAIAASPVLVAEMTEAAKQHLETVERATGQAR